jgi:hypothetical protein
MVSFLIDGFSVEAPWNGPLTQNTTSTVPMDAFVYDLMKDKVYALVADSDGSGLRGICKS